MVAILPSDSANRDFHYQVPVEGIIENVEVTIQRGKIYKCLYMVQKNQIIIYKIPWILIPSETAILELLLEKEHFSTQ